MASQSLPDIIFEIANFNAALQDTHAAIMALMMQTITLPDSNGQADRVAHILAQLPHYQQVIEATFKLSEVVTGVDHSEDRAQFARFSSDLRDEAMAGLAAESAAKH